MKVTTPRQLAFLALRAVQGGAFADVALDRLLRQAALSEVDRRLATELVYGSIRRQRTLDALIDQLGKKKAHQQPPDLRFILHLGLYQLRYLSHIPIAAAVDTTVELAKQNGLQGLAGFVNGLLRQYVRLTEMGEESGTGEWKSGKGTGTRRHGDTERKSRLPMTDDPSRTQNANLEMLPSETPSKQETKPPTLSPSHPPTRSPFPDPLILSHDPIARLAILHSYPDWIVQVWLEQFGFEAAEQLCQWFNHPPHIDLRINPLQTSNAEVEAAMQAAGIQVSPVPPLPQALRLPSGAGAIQNLPGFAEGWWTVQDSSAQLVCHLLDPQLGEFVVDACAAPGGKTTHLAELMQDQGVIWACDRHASRLRKVQENAKRLQLKSIQICAGDSRNFTQFTEQADRVLLDAPCSGLGTLHRHADARWRQTPESVQELAQLQGELLDRAATWVKVDGTLVYATCTLHAAENESVVQTFLANHPNWQIDPPAADHPAAAFITSEGWLKVLPHQQEMDGFFMARLHRIA